MPSSPKSDFFDEKIQRIAHALYLVTSYVPEQEPLRETIRITSLEMVQSLNSGHEVYSSRAQLFAPLLRQLISYVSLAKSSSLISPMNADVVAEEMKHFLSRVEEGEFDRRYLFADDYFITSTPIKSDENVSKTTDTSNNSSATSHRHNDNITKTTSQSKTTDSPSSTTSHQRQTKRHVSSSGSLSSAERRTAILALFTNEDSVITIHDVQASIPDVSVKTLQRELARMVEEGVLTKEGEKRWSEYRKAQ